MSEFEIWFYRVLIAALGIIVWFGIQRLISTIRELINEVKNLSVNYKVQASQILGILGTISDFTARLNDHSKRIRDIEIKRSKAHYGNEGN
jgi:hypothetical protein